MHKDQLKEFILKFLFRWWFAGAIYFFLVMGLNLQNPSNQIIFLGLGIGVVNTYIIQRFLDVKVTYDVKLQPKLNKYPIMRLTINVIYGMFVAFVIAYTYQFMNEGIKAIYHIDQSSRAPIPVEPILFGLFYAMYDSIFLFLIKIFTNIIKRKQS